MRRSTRGVVSAGPQPCRRGGREAARRASSRSRRARWARSPMPAMLGSSARGAPARTSCRSPRGHRRGEPSTWAACHPVGARAARATGAEPEAACPATAGRRWAHQRTRWSRARPGTRGDRVPRAMWSAPPSLPRAGARAARPASNLSSSSRHPWHLSRPPSPRVSS